MFKYSKEFKLKVILHYPAGNEGFAQATLSYGPHRDVPHKWAHTHQLHGEEGFSSDRSRYTQVFKSSVLRYDEL